MTEHPQGRAVPICRWAGVEGDAGGTSLGQAKGCQELELGMVGLLDPGDIIHSTWPTMLC